MASVNKVILVGNLGRDPESRYGADGSAIVNVSLATTDNWRDKSSGERKESTEWHRLVFFGKLAEIAGQYLKKGSQVYVEGSIKYDKYTGQDGVEKYTTDIVASELQMLGDKREGQPSAGGGHGGSRGGAPQRQRPATATHQPADDFADDDIPFIRQRGPF